MIIEQGIGTTPGAKIDSDTESVRDSVSRYMNVTETVMELSIAHNTRDNIGKRLETRGVTRKSGIPTAAVSNTLSTCYRDR